jgi:hypothetical protein
VQHISQKVLEQLERDAGSSQSHPPASTSAPTGSAVEAKVGEGGVREGGAIDADPPGRKLDLVLGTLRL